MISSLALTDNNNVLALKWNAENDTLSVLVNYFNNEFTKEN